MSLRHQTVLFTVLFAVPVAGGLPPPGWAQTGAGPPPAEGPPTAPYLRDRGEGVATSMFGTYIRRGELLVYPYFEHYRDRDFEYKAEELGFKGTGSDFRGRYRADEWLLFVAYGLTEDIALEGEVAVIRARLDKNPLDGSTQPARLEESGLGEVEGQLRWRWARETGARPELFSYTEFVVPHHGRKPLIGTPGTEVKFGLGLVRGLNRGTLTFKGSVRYEHALSSRFAAGEYGVEYLRRLSPSWRLYAAVEGTEDEVALIGEAQWFVSPRVCVKLNSGLGLTSKATDWAPEVGIVLLFPPR
ncbi:MAG: hypothetical protein FJW23_04120 [Acidimicrobiia bacterium]|nr:hypothetical protein [Acidimicrobiia bacterium]